MQIYIYQRVFIKALFKQYGKKKQKKLYYSNEYLMRITAENNDNYNKKPSKVKHPDTL